MASKTDFFILIKCYLMKTKNYLTPFLFTLFFFLIACSIQKQPLSSNQNNTTNTNTSTNGSTQPTNNNTTTNEVVPKSSNLFMVSPKKRNP